MKFADIKKKKKFEDFLFIFLAVPAAPDGVKGGGGGWIARNKISAHALI